MIFLLYFRFPGSFSTPCYTVMALDKLTSGQLWTMWSWISLSHDHYRFIIRNHLDPAECRKSMDRSLFKHGEEVPVLCQYRKNMI